MNISSTLYLASLALVAAACGGGSDKDPPVTLIDAPVQQVDAPAANCTAPATTAALLNPFYDYTADRDPDTTGNQESFFWGGDLNADTPVDWINIEMYEGTPPGFTTLNFPATPFTIELTGNELSYSSCSMCIRLQTDVDTSMEDLPYKDDYLATGGSITITTLSETNIAGTLNNVTFAHVDFAMDLTSTPNASGCTSTITSATFTGMVMPPMPEARDGKRRNIAARIRK